jgi:hypothetical protein
MFQTKVVMKIKTHILRTISFYSKNCTVYEVMWKDIAEPDWPQMTVRHMRSAY